MTPAAAARVERARVLATERPSGAGILAFYASLVTAQQALLDAASDRDPARTAAPGLAGAIDARAIAVVVPRFLDWLRHSAHAPLAEAAAALEGVGRDEWQRMCLDYIDAGVVESGDDTLLFVIESVLQPFAEGAALRWATDHLGESATSAESALPAEPSASAASLVEACPFCRSRPIVATLREQGHGSRRSLVCGLCLLEFRARRIACLACGQADFNALPIYRADDLPGVRIDTCDVCRSYVKTIDLTQSARAIPVVDDIASLPLDLWAREQGYRKIRANLLRL